VNNPRVLLKGKYLSKIVIFCNSIRTLCLIFSLLPVKCELDFHLDLVLSIRLDSAVQVVKVVRYDNRVPLTEIFNDKERML